MGIPDSPEEHKDLTPEAARAKDISPESPIAGRIPETERDDESPAGLGKGVGMPPGSTGRDSGQTP